MAYQILVVDDEPDVELLVRQRFRRNIRDREFEFFFSQNGEQALQTLGAQPGIQLVLTDINMPVMDGLTLLSRLAEFPGARGAVIVSAYGDMQNIRTAMNRGAVDFLMKPINFEDMETTIRKCLDLILQLHAAAEQNVRLASIQQELEMAARIQQALLPETFPPFPDRGEFELHAAMLPAKEVGGDFFDFAFLDEERLAFTVGDVSGKGVPAAIFMAMTQTLLRGAVRQRLSPGECLEHVNHTLAAKNPRSMFVTVFYGILNVRTGELQYANGGHNTPYLLSVDRGVRPLPAEGRGILIGALEDAVYTTECCVVEPDEAILVSTDGVTEAMDPLGGFYGDDRFERFLSERLAAPMPELVADLFSSIAQFADGAPQADDITALALRRLGPSA
jgi:phosphoserine phosphatase RsbU/P